MNYKSRLIRHRARGFNPSETRISNQASKTSKRFLTGFTLIELLVVIAIIALLLAILIPSLRKAKEKVKEVACKSNLKNVGVAMLMRLDDHNRILPDTKSSNKFLWYESDGVTYRQPGSSDTYWGIYYKDYLKDTKIFGCPSLQRVPEGRLIYSVPDVDKAIQHAAFGLNHHPRARDRNVETIRPHSEFVLCMDHAEPRPECTGSDAFHNNDTPGAMNLTAYRRGGSRFFSYRQIFRHNIRFSDDDRTGGRANFLWLDGHVSHIEETTGDDVPSRWFSGDHKKQQ